jgi:hypothetical protein
MNSKALDEVQSASADVRVAWQNAEAAQRILEDAQKRLRLATNAVSSRTLNGRRGHLPAERARGLSAATMVVRDFVRERGTARFMDIVRGARVPVQTALGALRSLEKRGIVTRPARGLYSIAPEQVAQ